MASEPIPFGEPPATAWAPSEAARGWLLLGCVAVLCDAGLSAAGLGASLVEADAGGFKLARALEWAALLPELGVLIALLTLAKEAQSRGLWKSSVGFVGVLFLGLVLDLAFDDQLGREVRTAAGVVAAVGMIGLVIVALGSWPRFVDTEGKPAAGPPTKNGKGCLAGAMLPILFIVAKIFAKGLPRLKLGADDWLAIEGCALAALALVFVVWFAWSKIQLAEKFGMVALLLGAFELLVLLGLLAGIGSFFAVAAPSMANGNDAEVERLAELWQRGGTMAGIGVYVVWAALAAWLFLSVRKLAERDWRFAFSPEGVNPWSADPSGRN